MSKPGARVHWPRVHWPRVHWPRVHWPRVHWPRVLGLIVLPALTWGLILLVLRGCA